MGDSITFGSGSTDGNGYRKLLFDYLYGPNEVHNIAYIGSQQSGSAGYRHEGHPGWRTDQLIDGVNRLKWLTNPTNGGPPQFVVLLTGANDAGQGHSWQQMVTDTATLLDLILAGSPSTCVVLCEQILMSGNINHTLSDNTRKQQAYNAALPGLAAARSGRVNIARLGIITQANLDPSGVHPTDLGYRMVAWLIYQAFAPWLGTDGKYMVNVECPFPFNPLA